MFLFLWTGREDSGEAPYSTMGWVNVLVLADVCGNDEHVASLLTCSASLTSHNKARGKWKKKSSRTQQSQRVWSHLVQKTSSYITVPNTILTFLSGLFCCGFVWVDFFLMNECCMICFSPAKSFMYFHALLDNNLLNAVCGASLILL